MPVSCYIYATLLVLYVLYVILIEKVSFSIKNIFFTFYFLFYGPAFFSYNNKIGFTDINTKTAYMLSVFIIFFWLGTVTLRAISNTKINYRNWYKQELSPVYINKVLLYFIVITTSFFMLLGLFFYGGINNFQKMLTSSLSEELVSALRAETADLGWSWSLINYITAALARFIAFILIGLYIINRDKLTLFVAIAYFSLVSLCLLANLSKSSFLVFFTQVLILIFLLKNIKLNLVKGLSILFVVLPLIIFIYLNYTTAKDAGTALDLISFRIFGEPNRVLNMYPENWPLQKPHTYGMNIRLIHNLFSSKEYVSASAYLGGNRKGISFNAIFIADAWVDFSYFGVALFSFLIGTYLSYLDYMCFRKKNIMNIALIASAIIGTFTLINSGMITALIGFGLLTMPILHFCLRIRFEDTRLLNLTDK